MNLIIENHFIYKSLLKIHKGKGLDNHFVNEPLRFYNINSGLSTDISVGLE